MSKENASAIALLLNDKSTIKTLSSNKTKHLDVTKLQGMAWSEVRENKALQNCTPQSVAGSLIKCAKLGLYPGSALGEAYLIPYGKECQLILGYRGMITLARRSGQIQSISSHCVYENDEFDYELGLHEKLKHIPAKIDRGPLIAVYAVAKLKDGGHQMCVMYKEDIDRVKKNTDPWRKHYEEMAKKTVIRRLFKYLPISFEMIEANKLDNAHENGEKQGNEKALEPERGDTFDMSDFEETETNTEETAKLLNQEVVNG